MGDKLRGGDPQLPRWFVDTLFVFAVSVAGFSIDTLTGTITATSYGFHTADFFGIPLLWTPGMAFAGVLFAGYFVGYRDILALEESNGA